MKLFLMNWILVFSFIAQGQVILAVPSKSLNNPEIKAICKQMSSNHLEDIDQLDRLYQELKVLNKNDKTADVQDIQNKADKVHTLILQIKEISSRIRYLLKPEWNIESVPIELIWEVPYSLFYDDTEYLDLKKQFNDDVADKLEKQRAAKFLAAQDSNSLARSLIGDYQGAYGGIGVDDDLLYKYITYNKNRVDVKEVENSIFLNTQNESIKEYLSLHHQPIDRTEYQADRSFLINYKKNATLLEACQFLNTLFFEVDIHYTYFAFDLKFQQNKKINLIYKNEVQNE